MVEWLYGTKTNTSIRRRPKKAASKATPETKTKTKTQATP